MTHVVVVGIEEACGSIQRLHGDLQNEKGAPFPTSVPACHLAEPFQLQLKPLTWNYGL